MRKPELNQENREVWNTITKEQKDVLVVFYDNYIKSIDDGPKHSFPTLLTQLNEDVFSIVAAATYVDVNEYIVFRSITQQQFNLIAYLYDMFQQLNEEEIHTTYMDEEVYNLEMDVELYILLRLFSSMDDELTFRFLTI